MKKPALVLFFALLSCMGFGQWVKQTTFAGAARANASAFAIGDTGFYIAGSDNSWTPSPYLLDSWKYVNGTWSRIADFPTRTNSGSVGFAIGDTGYVGTGASSPPSYTVTNGFYKYYHNTWTAIAALPGPGGGRWGAFAFEINDTAYVGGGFNGSNNNQLFDCYKYDPTHNKWTRIADCPAVGTIFCFAFALKSTGKGYVGAGADLPAFNPHKDFWEYDPSVNKWTAKANFGNPQLGGIAFATCDRGFAGGGVNNASQTITDSTFFEYNPVTDKWTAIDSLKGTPRYRESSWVIHDVAYVCGGADNAGGFYAGDLWSYTPPTSFKTSSAINAASLCTGDSIAFDDTTNFTPTNWQWTFPNGSPGTSTSQNPKIKYSTTGQFDVVLKAWNTCDSGSTTFSKYVTVGAAPSITIAPVTPTICSGKSITLKASGGTSYQWVTTSNTTDTIVASAINDTTYTLAVSNGTCIKDTAIAVNVAPSPNITASALPTSICSGNPTTLSATGGTSYLWSTGVTSSSISVSPIVDSTFTVTGSNGSGCSSIASLTVTVTPTPIPTVSTTQTICNGNSTPLSASGGSTYTWLPASGLSSSSIANPVANPTSTTTYTVTVANGSCTATDNVLVTVNSPPSVTACCATTILVGQSAPLDVTPVTSGDIYSWTPVATLSCNTCANPVATPSTSTWYYVTTTNNSCSILDSVLITAIENCGSVYIPNAFSPNGDGTNDILTVMGNCIKDMDLIIFDRWGNKVFESTNPKEGWDGTSKGKPMNTGTYVFSLQYSDLSNTSTSKKGNITLIR